MSNDQRPRSTPAQIVTACCAVVCALALAATAFLAVLGGMVTAKVVEGLGTAGSEGLVAMAVPASEAVCLNYTTTVLELDDAGLDHDAIVRVIDNAVQGEGADHSALEETREFSIASEDFCGPVRNVLAAAGR